MLDGEISKNEYSIGSGCKNSESSFAAVCMELYFCRFSITAKIMLSGECLLKSRNVLAFAKHQS